MCISCGCGKPNDDHGDARNITLQDVDQAAQAAGTTRARVFENMMQGNQQLSGGNVRTGQQATPQAAGLDAQAYSQSQAQNNRDAQEQAEPGSYAPSIGHDSGSDWGQDQQEINYRPPENQEHVS
jgi:hypothetical protein